MEVALQGTWTRINTLVHRADRDSRGLCMARDRPGASRRIRSEPRVVIPTKRGMERVQMERSRPLGTIEDRCVGRVPWARPSDRHGEEYPQPVHIGSMRFTFSEPIVLARRRLGPS